MVRYLLVTGVPKSAAAMEELRVAMLRAIKEKGFHTVVCCLDNGNDQIKEVLGASMMALTSKRYPEPEKISHMFTMSKSLKVWSKFSVKKKDGTVLNLQIVDMPKYLNDKVINLYTNHFVKEENTFIAAGFLKNPKAIEELQGPLLEATNEDGCHIVICCLDSGDDEIKGIVGASMMALVSKYDPQPEFDFKTPEMQKLFEIVHGLEAHYDEMKAFDLDRCFSDRGLFVCPEYRGLGIAQELLKARRLICKEYGIHINGAWMTSYGTQKDAERDEWETVCELTYEDLTKNFGIQFGKNPPSSKFMIARIQL